MANNPKRMAEASPFEVMKTYDGNVLSSGVPSRPENQHHDPMLGSAMLTEAVVTAVYFPDDERKETHKNRVWVTCDVRTIPRSVPLRQVPVYQYAHGLHDEDLWIPRAMKLDLDGGTLTGISGMKANAKTVKSTRPTNADSTDGDRVMIAFLNGNPANPIVLPLTKGHPKANSALKSSGGRVRRLRHHGTSIAWDKSGNLTIDASGAAKETLAAGGIEDPTGTAVVTIMADSQAKMVLEQSTKDVKFTSGRNFEVSATTKAVIGAPLVELSNAPLEPVLKGTSYVTAETVLYGFLTTYLAAVKPVWDIIAQAGAPAKVDLASVAATAAAAWPGGLATWVTASAASKSLKVTTG